MALLYDQTAPPGVGPEAPGQPPQSQPGAPPGPPPGPQVQPPAQPSRTEQIMAAQMHQMRQEIAQLTNLVMQLQTREVVHYDVTARRNDQNLIEGYTLIGRLG